MNKEFLENHILYFPSSAVQEFLRKQNAKYSNNDYEFFSCLLVNKFCERQWSKECAIGFPISPEFARRLSSRESATLEEVNKIFRKGINKNSPIDFIISSTEVSPVNFQIKRFGIGKDIRNTKALIDFLNSNKLTNLPTRNAICLIVALDPNVVFDGNEFSKKFDFSNFRFGGLILFGSRKIDHKVFYLQLFPKGKEGIAIDDSKLIQCDIKELSFVTC